MATYRRDDMKRQITKQMEICYRLRHHSFAGTTAKFTAKITGISIRQVNRLMSDMKKISPQLFPILTCEQALLWCRWFDDGLSCSQIAAEAALTERTIQARLQIVKKRMNYNEKVNSRAHKTVSFDAGIDETKIKQKF